MQDKQMVAVVVGSNDTEEHISSVQEGKEVVRLIGTSTM